MQAAIGLKRGNRLRPFNQSGFLPFFFPADINDNHPVLLRGKQFIRCRLTQYRGGWKPQAVQW